MKKEYNVDPKDFYDNLEREIIGADLELNSVVDALTAKFSTIGFVDSKSGRSGDVKQERKHFIIFGQPESECESVAKSMSRENYARYLSIDEIKDAHPETRENPRLQNYFIYRQNTLRKEL